MGLISCHRAGVAKRQARAAMRASRRLSRPRQNEELVEVVERQALMIEDLERQLDELRATLGEGSRVRAANLGAVVAGGVAFARGSGWRG
jgi:hypothetical protein